MIELRTSGVPVIDVRGIGIGDAVVACWIAHSARAVNRLVRINAGSMRDVATLLGLPDHCLTPDDDIAGAIRPNLGQSQYSPGTPSIPRSGFDILCQQLQLPRLEPVRPPYCEAGPDGVWADQQWRTVDPSAGKTRVLLFPEAAWPLRTWPLAYFIDLANELAQRGCAVAAMSSTQRGVQNMPCHWWGGFSLGQVAAMCRRAQLVVSNESGPAHLAAAIGVPTMAICGATDPRIIFGHEPNVRGVHIDPGIVPCVGCHFSAAGGYRHACDVGGCQALMRFDPTTVVREIVPVLDRLHEPQLQTCP